MPVEDLERVKRLGLIPPHCQGRQVKLLQFLLIIADPQGGDHVHGPPVYLP